MAEHEPHHSKKKSYKKTSQYTATHTVYILELKKTAIENTKEPAIIIRSPASWLATNLFLSLCCLGDGQSNSAPSSRVGLQSGFCHNLQQVRACHNLRHHGNHRKTMLNQTCCLLKLTEAFEEYSRHTPKPKPKKA